MVVREIVTVFATLCVGAVFARSWQNGNLTVELSDVEGNPITDAKVTVKSGKGVVWGRGTDSEYNFTAANSDANGIAAVNFKFCEPYFTWRLETPSHYSQRYFTPREFFNCEVVESDYKTFNTNTVEGLAKWNELKKLEDAGDADSMLKYMEKFAPKSVTYTNNGIRRSLRFYPKKNPQSMYAYGESDYLPLPADELITITNGCQLIAYPAVEYDMEKNSYLPSQYIGKSRFRQGKVCDFRLERYCVETNGVENFYGKIVFAPGCGAYRHKKTGDASFPSTYEADTNALYESELTFYALRDVKDDKTISYRDLLDDDEYMVIRTRMSVGEGGCTNGWHYAKILGPIRIFGDISFKESVFNPRLNDPNLELDLDRNLAGRKYDVVWP